MTSWSEGIQSAISYIEDNITERLAISDIAEKRMYQNITFKESSVFCAVLPWVNI